MLPTAPDPTIAELVAAIASRQVSASEVTQSYLERIEARNEELNCYVTVDADAALARAAELDGLSADSRATMPLFGIPVGLKDNIATAGLRTTVGTPLLSDWVPDRDAAVVDLLRNAGAVVLGKLTMYQFALRGPHPDFGDARNPWDTSRSCAGSSSGSGCAVAAGLAAATLGTDTAGSLRLPAAVCGVVGHKPTYGRVSTAGIFPAAPSLDHVGPLTRTATDARIVLDALTGGSGALAPARSLEGVRVGVPELPVGSLIEDEMRAAYERALETMRTAGATLVDVSLPSFGSIRSLVFILASPEIAAVHERYLRERPDAYSAEVRQQISLGTVIPASEYVHAQRVREEVVAEYAGVMQDIDVLASPVIPLPAWPIDSGTHVTINGEEHDLLQLITHYCPPVNVTKQPAVSVPCGFSSEGLPLAFQLAGHLDGDDELLRVAEAYEAISGLERPALPTAVSRDS